MRMNSFGAAIVITAALVDTAAAQQQVMMTPYGGTKPQPVSQTASDASDSPEEIAKDAARDLKDSRFYNKPGATRAEYNADWQQCRLIARGSATPSGSVPVVYNPNMVSPLAAGVGGAIGSAIGAAIAEGIQRRANRRTCLLIKGWRLVELPPAEQQRVAAMTDEQRSSYQDSIVGAQTVDGKITELTSFSLKADPALNLEAPVTGIASVFIGRKIDPRTPVVLGAGEGAVVLAFRRPDANSAGRSGMLNIVRYDMATRDVVYKPRDWKKKGDKTTYGLPIVSGDRTSPYEVQVVRLTAGDYVIDGTGAGPGLPVASNCFGAPTFHVSAGEVVYLGDFTPFWNVKLSDGTRIVALGYSAHIEEARTALATKQAALAAALKPAVVQNRATYGCSAIAMNRWDIPGMPSLPDPAPAPAAATIASPASTAPEAAPKIS